MACCSIAHKPLPIKYLKEIVGENYISFCLLTFLKWKNTLDNTFLKTVLVWLTWTTKIHTADLQRNQMHYITERTVAVN